MVEGGRRSRSSSRDPFPQTRGREAGCAREQQVRSTIANKALVWRFRLIPVLISFAQMPINRVIVFSQFADLENLRSRIMEYSSETHLLVSSKYPLHLKSVVAMLHANGFRLKTVYIDRAVPMSCTRSDGFNRRLSSSLGACRLSWTDASLRPYAPSLAYQVDIVRFRGRPN
jgi:hypothetical protein